MLPELSSTEYMVSNAVLLIPVREPDTVACILAVVIPVMLFLQLRLFSGSPSLTTQQGRFVRMMLAAPVLILVGRTFLYYELTIPLFGVTALGFGLALRLEGLGTEETREVEVGAEVEVAEVLRLKPGLIREAEPNVWEWVPLTDSADPPSTDGD